MKRTKFLAAIAALGLAATLSIGFASCKNNDDDDNSSGNTATKSTAEIELEDAAFNILRSLCLLPTDDD